jgi:hypothetical protein
VLLGVGASGLGMDERTVVEFTGLVFNALAHGTLLGLALAGRRSWLGSISSAIVVAVTVVVVAIRGGGGGGSGGWLSWGLRGGGGLGLRSASRLGRGGSGAGLVLRVR